MTDAVAELIAWRRRYGGCYPPCLVSGDGRLDEERGDAWTRLAAIIDRIEAEDERENEVAVRALEAVRSDARESGSGYCLAELEADVDYQLAKLRGEGMG